MTEQTLSFVPHSDLNPDGTPTGFKASLCNAIQNKLREIQIRLLNKSAAPDEYYSLQEPTEEEMQEKLFWIQPVADENILTP